MRAAFLADWHHQPVLTRANSTIEIATQTTASMSKASSAYRKGGWHDVTVSLDRFLQTHKGRLIETRQELNIHRILSLGISTASLGDAKQDGPFCLGIESIKANRQGISPVEE